MSIIRLHFYMLISCSLAQPTARNLSTDRFINCSIPFDSGNVRQWRWAIRTLCKFWSLYRTEAVILFVEYWNEVSCWIFSGRLPVYTILLFYIYYCSINVICLKNKIVFIWLMHLFPWPDGVCYSFHFRLYFHTGLISRWTTVKMVQVQSMGKKVRHVLRDLIFRLFVLIHFFCFKFLLNLNSTITFS